MFNELVELEGSVMSLEDALVRAADDIVENVMEDMNAFDEDPEFFGENTAAFAAFSLGMYMSKFEKVLCLDTGEPVHMNVALYISLLQNAVARRKEDC